MIWRLLIAALLSLPALAFAAPAPAPYTANYEVLRNGDQINPVAARV